MTESGRAELERARQEIQAAHALIQAGFATQAISRAYYAAFFAAEAALLVVGQSRSKHSGVISAFGQFLVRDGAIEPRHGKALRALFDQRNAADYGLVAAGDEDARLAVADAEALVEAVATWMTGSGKFDY